jgi:hypothetical protein
LSQLDAKQKYAEGRQGPQLNLDPQAQGRKQQLALLRLLEASGEQPTAAVAAGQKTLGQSAYQAAQGSAMGGGVTRAAEASRQAQDVVGQVGEQAKSQDMARRNMQVIAGTQARGQDQQVTRAQQNADLAQKQTNQAMVQYYMTLGDDYQTAERRAIVEAQKLYHARVKANRQLQDDFVKKALEYVGTIAKMMGG